MFRVSLVPTPLVLGIAWGVGVSAFSVLWGQAACAW